MKLIDNDPSLPQYERIRRYILRGIGSGAWVDGGRIPSENELVELFGVSRMTVNRALRELTAEGVLVRVQGVGTFAAKLTKAQSALLRTQDIAEEIKLRGHEHSCRVIALEQVTASIAVQEQLELPSGSNVFHSVIAHSENGVPVQLETRWISPVFAPQYLEQDFQKITTHHYLINCAVIAEIEHVIHATLPTEEEANLLRISQSNPCLLLLRRTWSGRAVVTFSRFVYPGQHYALGGRFRTDEKTLSTSEHLSFSVKRPVDK